MIAVDFGGAQRPGRDLPGGESLPLPVQTSFCFGFEEVFEVLMSSMLLCVYGRHVEVDRDLETRDRLVDLLYRMA